MLRVVPPESRSVAAVIVITLLVGLFASTATTWSETGVSMCTLHGRSCTCLQHCDRKQLEHNHDEPASETARPVTLSCNQSANSKSTPNPHRQIKSCNIGDSFTAALKVSLSLPAPDSETGLITLISKQTHWPEIYLAISKIDQPPPSPPPRI